ncbi:class I SAM-dependent methyltransferase [Rugamonas rubra]|uniref:Methyltransferase domain-containing protein n=1 Tax=Rugamonas rubra TaxID=758825 RepID=A0A1I4N0Y9_9BURK|nr:methyltransferase domain-containing protein [Rugamonas rubra]SFM08976.1 Methyltransferase domain-containing protein [Rugamonas rubra]
MNRIDAPSAPAAENAPDTPRRLLHVGCGSRNPQRLPACFRGPQWHEIRLDIDRRVAPDIVGSIVDLGMIEAASIDAIWCSHNLEHLEGFQVPLALAEFRRVLRDDGYALITLPDLRAIALQILDERLAQPLYQSAAGPIAPLDILFGHQAALAAGNGHMAHRTGFTANTLGQSLLAAGFHEVRVHEGRRWDLWAVASMPATDGAVFEQLAMVAQ